jgi:hypothetical protein
MYASSEGCISRLPQSTPMLEQDPSQTTPEVPLPGRPRAPLSVFSSNFSRSLSSALRQPSVETEKWQQLQVQNIPNYGTKTITGIISTSLANLKAEQRAYRLRQTQDLHLQCLGPRNTQVSNKWMLMAWYRCNRSRVAFVRSEASWT